MSEIVINITNLTDEERRQLLELIEKAGQIKGKVWEPEFEERYYYIFWDGTIKSTINNSANDKWCYELGNAFKTVEEVEEEITRRKILTKWKRLSIEAGEEENEWNGDNEHWCCYANRYGKINVSPIYTDKYEGIYFPTEKLLLNAIAEIGEKNVKKYILNVYDD